jgi:hypothetical protein
MGDPISGRVDGLASAQVAARVARVVADELGLEVVYVRNASLDTRRDSTGDVVEDAGGIARFDIGDGPTDVAGGIARFGFGGR